MWANWVPSSSGLPFFIMSKRPYKPTSLRALEGGRSHSLEKPEKAMEKEAKPYPLAPKIENSIDKNAKEIWEELAPKLERLGLLTEIDGLTFAALCQLAARMREFWKELKTEKDTDIRAKLMKTERQYYQNFLKFAKEFGLSPLGRTGLTINTEHEDEGADLLTK